VKPLRVTVRLQRIAKRVGVQIVVDPEDYDVPFVAVAPKGKVFEGWLTHRLQGESAAHMADRLDGATLTGCPISDCPSCQKEARQ
jgi:hypothetical protein